MGKEDIVVVRGEFNNGYMCDSPHWVPIPGQGLGCMVFFLGSVRCKRAMCPSSGEQADYICKFVSQSGEKLKSRYVRTYCCDSSFRKPLLILL